MSFNGNHLRSARLCALATALFMALFIAGCRSTPPSSTLPPSTAPVSADTWAVVDGKEITRNDVETAFRRAGDPTQVLSEDEVLTAKLGVLDDLILEEVLLAKARQQNLQVADGEVDAAYAEATKNTKEDVFQQQLAQRNLTVADMREGLRRQLVSRKLIDRDVVSRIVVTDQQVTDFFNANRAKFNLPEDAVHLAQIVVTPVRESQLANRTGDDAGTPEAADAKIAMLLERLKQGAAFADLARDYSEDPESASRGGDLGLVALSNVKQAPPALRDAALQLSPGKARVVSQGGTRTIVFVVAREHAGQRDLSTQGVREQITETLRTRRDQLLRAAYLTAARTDARVINYLARRVVQSQGMSPDPRPAGAK